MGNTENHSPNEDKRATLKDGVKIVIRREFTGDSSVTEALIPIIFEDIRISLDRRTFDNMAVGQ